MNSCSFDYNIGFFLYNLFNSISSRTDPTKPVLLPSKKSLSVFNDVTPLQTGFIWALTDVSRGIVGKRVRDLSIKLLERVCAARSRCSVENAQCLTRCVEIKRDEDKASTHMSVAWLVTDRKWPAGSGAGCSFCLKYFQQTSVRGQRPLCSPA